MIWASRSRGSSNSRASMKIDRSVIAVAPSRRSTAQASPSSNASFWGASATGPGLFSGIRPAEHLLAEPGAGIGPTTAGGPGRQAQGLGGLGEGQAREVSQLHQVGRLLVLRGELLQGLIQGEQIRDPWGECVPPVVEVRPMPAAPL